MRTVALNIKIAMNKQISRTDVLYTSLATISNLNHLFALEIEGSFHNILLH